MSYGQEERQDMAQVRAVCLQHALSGAISRRHGKTTVAQAIKDAKAFEAYVLGTKPERVIGFVPGKKG